MRLMSEDDCQWVQIGTYDWGEDSGLVKDSAWGEVRLLAYFPEGSILSDVEEAPAQVVSTPWGDRMDYRVHGMGDGTGVHRAVGVAPAGVLFAEAARVRQDGLDEVLRGKGKLTSKWADSLHRAIDVRDDMEVSEDDTSLVGERLRRPGRSDGMCREKFDAVEATLDRVAKMVAMLVAAGGLASSAARLAVEKHKGKVAQE